MTRTDYVYVNIDKPLAKVVDSAVENTRRRGSQVYKNRRAFVESAIHQMLDKETGVKA